MILEECGTIAAETIGICLSDGMRAWVEIYENRWTEKSCFDTLEDCIMVGSPNECSLRAHQGRIGWVERRCQGEFCQLVDQTLDRSEVGSTARSHAVLS